jgi:hypothetical protein
MDGWDHKMMLSGFIGGTALVGLLGFWMARRVTKKEIE